MADVWRPVAAASSPMLSDAVTDMSIGRISYSCLTSSLLEVRVYDHARPRPRVHPDRRRLSGPRGRVAQGRNLHQGVRAHTGRPELSLRSRPWARGLADGACPIGG